MRQVSAGITVILMMLSSYSIYSQTNIPTTQDSLQIFQNYSASLDPNDLSTLDKIVSRYKHLFENSSAFTKDTAFIIFWRYYVTVADSLGAKYVRDIKYSSFFNIKNFDVRSSQNERLKKNLKNKNTRLSEQDFEILKNVNHYGYKFDMIEGVILVSIADPKFILNNFSGLISSGLKSYITKVIEEIDTAESSDSAQAISLDELANRLIWWEKFINNNMDFLLLDDCITTYDGYLYTLMLGSHNNPAFNYENRKLKESYKKIYEKIIRHYRSTNAAEVISQYYSILKKNNFIINREALNFASQFFE